MRAVVQRVRRARVQVGEETVGEIGAGLLIFLGVAPEDDRATAAKMAERLASMRILQDAAGRMNRSLLDSGGGALVVSQFTLFADNRRGHRPSFLSAGPPEAGRRLCAEFALALRALGVERVESGEFGADMLVEASNDGPVTIVCSVGEEGWDTGCG